MTSKISYLFSTYLKSQSKPNCHLSVWNCRLFVCCVALPSENTAFRTQNVAIVSVAPSTILQLSSYLYIKASCGLIKPNFRLIYTGKLSSKTLFWHLLCCGTCIVVAPALLWHLLCSYYNLVLCWKLLLRKRWSLHPRKTNAKIFAFSLFIFKSYTTKFFVREMLFIDDNALVAHSTEDMLLSLHQNKIKIQPPNKHKEDRMPVSTLKSSSITNTHRYCDRKQAAFLLSRFQTPGWQD